MHMKIVTKEGAAKICASIRGNLREINVVLFVFQLL